MSRMSIALVAVFLVLVLVAPSSAQFDNRGRNIGLGGYTGLSLLFAGDTYTAFSFGGHARIKMIEGFYLDPGADFMVRSGGWDLSFGPYAQYVFRINNSIAHPYVGFGPVSFHLMHASGVESGYYDWYGQWVSVGGESSTKFYVGLNWQAGCEFVLNKQISLNFDWKYHLLLSDGSPGIMQFQAGFFYYLP